MIFIRNESGKTLYISRAVYFRDKLGEIPIYANARPSQKHPGGYEVKFGTQWKEFDVLIPSREQADTYVPLEKMPLPGKGEVGHRGMLLLEYVSDGKAGKHYGSL